MPLNANISRDQLPEDASSGLQRGSKVRVVTLAKGLRVFRGGNTRRPDGTPVAPQYWSLSPWWLYEEDWHKILAASFKHQGQFLGSPGFILRQAAAVKQRWSRVDVRIKAEVIQEIDAFEGTGQTQFEQFPNGIRVVWKGWRAGFKQLYIPNLDRSSIHPNLVYFDGTPALRILEREIIASEQPFGVGGYE